MTQACALSCQHCRAAAMDRRDPGELTLEEGKRLIDGTAAMGTRIMVLSGGDPLQRDDLEDLIRHGKAQGLRMGTIPAATPRLTRERVGSLRDAGLDQMALSLDGATAASHDAFRKVPGSFEKTMAAAAWAKEAGLPLQINTCFGGWNADDFEAIAARVEALGVVFWEVFFLVPVGRGRDLPGLTGEQCEAVFAKLYALQQRVPFIMKSTEAPHYSRYVAQQGGERVKDLLVRPMGPRGVAAWRPAPSTPARFCFVATPATCSLGYSPVSAGNAGKPLEEIYRESSCSRSCVPSFLGADAAGVSSRLGGSRSRLPDQTSWPTIPGAVMTRRGPDRRGPALGHGGPFCAEEEGYVRRILGASPVPMR